MGFMTTRAIELATRLKRQVVWPITLTTQVTALATLQQKDRSMVFSAIILSIMLPLQISHNNPKFGPFIVKATVDAAVIAGFPASKSAKKYALQAQKPDFLMSEAHLTNEPVGWRRLYFRKLFS